MSAAVVGAGLAGLTAAYELQRAGTDVVVLESGRHAAAALPGSPSAAGA